MDPGYESSDYETSVSCRSTSSSEMRPEDMVRQNRTDMEKSILS